MTQEVEQNVSSPKKTAAFTIVGALCLIVGLFESTIRASTVRARAVRSVPANGPLERMKTGVPFPHRWNPMSGNGPWVVDNVLVR